MKNVKVALAAGLTDAVRTAFALVRSLSPIDMGTQYDSTNGKPVTVLTDYQLDESIAFDYWFAHQSAEVREFKHEYHPGCWSSPEYFWRGVFAQLFCHYHRAAWYASEKPGPFEWNAANHAAREGKSLVVMEGLS